jgi:hypothetical protein
MTKPNRLLAMLALLALGASGILSSSVKAETEEQLASPVAYFAVEVAEHFHSKRPSVVANVYDAYGRAQFVSFVDIQGGESCHMDATNLDWRYGLLGGGLDCKDPLIRIQTVFEMDMAWRVSVVIESGRTTTYELEICLLDDCTEVSGPITSLDPLSMEPAFYLLREGGLVDEITGIPSPR